MKIEYGKLTEEQLEKWVEFVDWFMVPSHLLTPRIIKDFSPVFKELMARMWFEELLGSLEIKVDKEEYPDNIFFFKENEWFMDLDEKTGNLWCSYDKIWLVFEKKIGRNYNEIQRFIKNIVEMHFKNMEVTPTVVKTMVLTPVEMHFKNMEVTPRYQEIQNIL